MFRPSFPLQRIAEGCVREVPPATQARMFHSFMPVVCQYRSGWSVSARPFTDVAADVRQRRL